MVYLQTVELRLVDEMAMDSGLIDKPVAKSDLVDDSFAKKAAGK